MNASSMVRKQGGAIVWVLLIVVVFAAGFLIWHQTKPRPKPVRVVAAETPPPATPLPATPTPAPTPVVVKATPTPPPPVAVATPTPPPTLDLATVVRTPALWPSQVALTKPVAVPVMLNGRAVGEATVPAGTALRTLRVQNQHVEVQYQAGKQLVPIASTDLMQRALATFRNNGYVIPQAPTATPAPALAAATPPPTTTTTDVIRVEVGADRKRLDLVRDTKSRGGQVRDSVEKCNYLIKVQNRSFGEAPELDMQYVIFIERQMIGERKDKDTIERVVGSGKIPALTRKAPLQTVTTSEFELHQRELSGGYSYGSRGRDKVEDNIAGIWVKITHGGKVIAEYANPSTVTKRGWEPPSS